MPGTPVKCVVWDLDNTLWDGILLEDCTVAVRPGLVDIVERLDARGILQSVASRNDAAAALTRLEELGLDEYMLVPQIGWHPKSVSVGRIAQELNIGIDSLLFVDDDAFERAEVGSAHPGVRLVAADEVADLLVRPDMSPNAVTEDGAQRRFMYRAAESRAVAEREFVGTSKEFLAGLGLHLTVRFAGQDDLARAEELTVRTHQLNATGYTYSAEELAEFCSSPDHSLILADLRDRFGSYGTVGLVLIEHSADSWTVKLLLVSCRVLSRGTGTMLLNLTIARALAAGKRLYGEFVPTDRNRAMFVAYRFAGFQTVADHAGSMLLEFRGDAVPPIPEYVRVGGDI